MIASLARRIVPTGAMPVIAAAIALVAVLGLMQFATGGRVAYTMDSLTYRDAALNFAAGHGMRATNVMAPAPELQPLVVWPPAYAALWASATGLDPENVDDTPAWLNAVLLGLTALAMFWICRMVTGKPGIAAVVAAVTALAPTTVLVYGHAWSETLFIPLLLLAYGALWKYRSGGESLIWLAVAATLVGAANWVRYSGVVFLPILGLSVLAASGAGLRKRILHAGSAMFLGAAVVLPLWLRNWQLAGNISGSNRGGMPATSRWLEDAAAIVDLFEHSLFSFSMVLRANMELPLLVAIAFVSFRAFRQRGVQWLRPPEVWLPMIWFAGYLLFLLVARRMQTRVDLDLRMLAIAVPFLLLAMTPAVNAALSDRVIDTRKVLVIVVLGLLVNAGINQAWRAHESYALNGVPRWRATFGLDYRDLHDTSPTSRAISENLGGIHPGALILTDYRALYLRYLTGAKVYTPDAGDCAHWTGSREDAVLFIGAPELPVWALDCLKANSHWRLVRPTGRAAPSMYAD